MNIDEQTIKEISVSYDLGKISLTPFGNGLINKTWKLSAGNKHFILQRLNQSVFNQPYSISSNLRTIKEYLKQKYPGYMFVAPIDTSSGEPYFEKHGELYRLFPFVEGSVSHNVASTPNQAYQAAKQFGRFTRLLKNIDTSKLALTIPGFHDLPGKLKSLDDSAKNSGRAMLAKPLLEKIESNKNILAQFLSIKNNPAYTRVVHHDCKINNVLFDKNDEAICIIDLDTVMPGLYISDTGDMMRTYLCAVNEEEKDLEKIIVRSNYYSAIREGYLEEMTGVLSEEELNLFFFSGSYMIYLQAVRFLDDYLRYDKYYPVQYEDHNLARAANQLTLLEKYLEMESVVK
jgi:Ser/Thr protein kinase RdoA (MazF antagonist)